MSRHVLVVDDDLDIRETIAEILEDNGFSVTTASNGMDALQKLQSGARPDVVVLDLMMPVLDGPGFCAKLREDAALADLPVVVISAFHDVEQFARDLHVCDYLAKPLDLHNLIETVTRCSQPGGK